MSGWSSIGAALGGVDQASNNAYATGVYRGAQGADLLEQARQRRDQNIARAALTPENVTTALQDPGGQGSSAIISAILQSGGNLNEQTLGLGNEQNQRIKQAALTAATGSGGIAAANPILAVMAGKPVVQSAVQGNTLISPFLAPDQQANVGGNVPTAVGQASIADAMAGAGAHNAAAADSYAAAGHQNAETANVGMVIKDDGNGGFTRMSTLNPGASVPVTNADGTQTLAPVKVGAGAGAVTDPSPSLMKSVFGQPVVGSKPDTNVSRFLAWKAQQATSDPRYNNGNFALQQWAANGPDQQAPLPGAITPVKGQTIAQAIVANGIGTPAESDIAQAMNPGVAGAPDIGSSAGNAAAPTTLAAPASTDAVATPKSTADYNALPAGTKYLNPADGIIKVKGAK
jgi:hypothetical protein